MKRPQTHALIVVLALGATALFLYEVFSDGSSGTEITTPEQPADADREANREAPIPPPPLEGREKVDVADATREPAVSAPTDRAALEPGTGGLSGAVVTPARQAVQEARVELLIGSGTLALDLPAARTTTGRYETTTEDGAFHFEDLPPGNNYALEVTHPDFAATDSAGITVRDGDMTLVPEIVLSRGSRIYGTVRDKNGNAIPEAHLELWDSLKSNFMTEEQKQPWKTASTDADGKYEFAMVHFNALEVVASAPGYATTSQSNTTIFSQTNDREMNFDLPDSVSLTGTVINKAGQPIGEASIHAYQMSVKKRVGASKGDATSNQSGFFSISDLAEGKYTLTAKATGYSDKNQSHVESGVQDLVLQLNPRGSIEGVVKDAGSRQPVANFQLHLMRKHSEGGPVPTGRTENFTSPDGSFEMFDIDPGDYVVEASSTGYAPCFSSPIWVKEGQPTTGIEVLMDAGSSLSGIVTATNGEPLFGALVKLNHNNYQANPIMDIFGNLPNTPKQRKFVTRTGKDGRFSLEFIIPDTYQVEVSKNGFSNRTINDVVLANRAAGSSDMRIILSSGGQIIGQCVDASGRPFADGKVNCTSTTGAMLTGRPDYDGRFEFGNLAPGEYTLMLNPDKMGDTAVNPLLGIIYAQKTETRVNVREGSMTQVTLTLPPPDDQ